MNHIAPRRSSARAFCQLTGLCSVLLTAGAAYASFFTLGACIGAKGGGRGVFLFVNWVLGAGKGAAALLVPYGHVRSLLGGEPVLTLSQRGSTLGLAAVAGVALALASWRGRK